MMLSFVNIHLWVNESGFDYSRLSCRVSLCNYLGKLSGIFGSVLLLICSFIFSAIPLAL